MHFQLCSLQGSPKHSATSLDSSHLSINLFQFWRSAIPQGSQELYDKLSKNNTIQTFFET